MDLEVQPRLQQHQLLDVFSKVVSRSLEYEPSMKNYYSYSENDWYEWLKQQETHLLFDCDPYLYYHTGMLIWSYIYGTYGPYKANEFFNEISKFPVDNTLAKEGIPQSSWKKAYEVVFGVKVDDDYRKLAKFIFDEAQWGKKNF